MKFGTKFKVDNMPETSINNKHKSTLGKDVSVEFPPPEIRSRQFVILRDCHHVLGKIYFYMKIVKYKKYFLRNTNHQKI